MPRYDAPALDNFRRVLNVPAVARLLGRKETWFREHRAELESAGFPKPMKIVNGYDRKAVEDWLSKQHVAAQPAETATAKKRNGWEAAARG